MFWKCLILCVALVAPQTASAGVKDVSFDSAVPAQIKPLIVENMADIPSVQLPPRPEVKAYGESDDGKIVKLPPIAKNKDTYSDGIHYSWVPGLKSVIFDMTCDKAQSNWQLRIMKPINLPQRAGHDHALGDLPTGTTYYPAPDPQEKATYYIDGQIWTPQFNYLGEAMTSVLGPTSFVRVSIPDPKYSTSIALPLQYSGACNSSETRYMDIKVPDLVALPVNEAIYVLYGGKKGVHTQTHYGTVETIAALKTLAIKWRAKHPLSNRLAFNDISLPWGGAFELKGNWDANGSHFNHSFGVAADVSKLCVKKSDRADLIKLMGEIGFTVRSEGDPSISTTGVLIADRNANHYHIQFTPEIKRLMNFVLPGTAIKFPITADGTMNGVNPSDQEQTDYARSVFGDIPDARYTTNCQNYMSYVNNCSKPIIGSNEDKYCHCISLFTGLTTTAEKPDEPIGYDGCPKTTP